MECRNCESKQRHFYCENCIRTHLRDFRLQIQHAAVDRDEQVRKVTAAIDTISGSRIRRADLTSSQEELDVLNEGLTQLRRDNDKTKQRLQTISRARSGLVSELVEVFNIVEVGGRPPIGGKAGTKGEWTIGDLVLPVPGDIRRYPPDHINAVITHTLHFIGLLTFYLGIRLPFEIAWTGGKLGVGQPWIRSIKGTESGSWAKYTSKHCLHVSASSPTPVADVPAALIPSPSDSYIETRSPPNPSSSFTTAYAMLLYNVCYLAHTQAVEIPLSQAGDVLSNLWAVCCSAELGRRSHQTHPLLPPPTPPSFPLDFGQLLQATPASRPRPTRPRTAGLHKNRNNIPEEDEWDLLDDAGAGATEFP
ncbi:UV radiation resistance protein and autophagy-related subunit 14-domain-containing protein [Lactarius sanguifluus]|nr:UV radiation resistance protein and autophagy-related subunit 14-domain-containing protein [Lactarius sanguifluus]